ncbi:MAG: NADPH:quinone oxidoreductase family protein [Deltaproteobacteria bacterium]|nr:NADPH:quinone oxidoreductase family protein [Deltaproteobacteria bacterium]MBW2362030.1 NADPH:quinone oxidoreductase family protein [Deltaproteobacteria bacterium]
MRAVVVERLMDPSELRVSEVDVPPLRPGTLELEVRAAGCNFSDILMAKGEYQVKPAFPFVPGAEVAGVVSAVGEGVEGFNVGDRVLSSPGLGGFAERVVVPTFGTFKLPDGMSFEEGASLPVVYPTSYMALVFRADLQPGEDLLVHAAAGGVGIAALQIGRALGARVIATAGGAEKLEVARQNGADDTIDYREEDFVERVMALTDGKGADVIYDSVGGDTFDKSLKCIAWNGRLLVIGFASGTIPSVKANRILLKNIAVTGLNWGGHAVNEPHKITQTLQALFDLHAAGEIRPVIYKTYPLEQLSDALAALGGRRTYGKVIVAP